jgi:phosphomevalonate kinase
MREERAKNLLENELFIEAFDVLEKEMIEMWHQSGVQDIDQREAFWLASRLLKRIKSHIVSIVETGKIDKILDKQHPYI